MAKEDYPSSDHYRFAQFIDKTACSYFTGLKGKEDPYIPAGQVSIKFYNKQDTYDFAEFLNKLKPKTKLVKRGKCIRLAKKQSVLWQLRKDIMKAANEVGFKDDGISGYCLVFWFPDSNDANDMRTRMSWVMKGYK